MKVQGVSGNFGNQMLNFHVDPKPTLSELEAMRTDTIKKLKRVELALGQKPMRFDDGTVMEGFTAREKRDELIANKAEFETSLTGIKVEIRNLHNKGLKEIIDEGSLLGSLSDDLNTIKETIHAMHDKIQHFMGTK